MNDLPDWITGKRLFVAEQPAWIQRILDQRSRRPSGAAGGRSAARRRPETAMNYSRRQASKVIDSISQRRGRDFVLPFGKFSGRRLADVPIEYIRWIESNGIGGPKLQAAIREMKSTRQI